MSARSGSVIEIAALFEDSVVSVRHLQPPRDPRPTRALLAAGAACLVATAIAFAHGVHVAAVDQQARAAWQSSGESMIDYRAPRLSAAWDVMALVGLVSGLGLVGWGLARLVDERRPSRFRVGRAAGVDFGVDGVGDHELVTPNASDDGFVLRAFPGLTVEVDGHAASGDVAITANTRVRARAGLASFTVAEVPASRATGGGAALDRRVLTCAGASAGGHLVVLALLFLIVPASTGYAADDAADRRRLVTNTQVKPAEESLKKPEDDGGAGQKGGTSAPEGALGKPDVTTKGRAEAPKVADEKPRLAFTKEQRDEVARDSGALHLLRATNAFQAIATNDDFSAVGLDDRAIEGGFIGPPGENRGGFGSGVDGTGPGGTPCYSANCPNWGTIHAGNFHTPGGGNGPIGVGPGLPQHTAGGPILVIGPVNTPEDVDPELVRRYVRKQADKIQYCYQRELQGKPGLEGTVTSRFTIDPNGRVISVQASGLDDNVASCVGGILQSIEFPKFGMVVNITSYPFHFHSN